MMTPGERTRALWRLPKHLLFIFALGIITLFELPGGGSVTVRMLIGNVLALMILGHKFPQAVKDCFRAITYDIFE